ncbi:hypothetical protein GSI_10309 [Ganoderma sinense ZZ0214-1]|uniref:Protein kinase domain-containing protein n=1 Tax=Ganoderma sinense ZZ0214-1 TaxID=1077348 RepID=A0A2G8S095_9APHY|nr:hypothetical protein GSI_10309 [Ganoderma sinense ZZ0214-1]
MRNNFDDGNQWSLDKERKYRRYLNDVATSAVPYGDFDCQLFFCEGEDGEFEEWLRHSVEKVYRSERDTYERLPLLQGKIIPRLRGVVKYEVTVPDACDDGSTVTETIPGLLLEYVSGSTLRQLVMTWTARDPPLPNTVLATLCEEVVKAVDRLSDFDLLNRDVRIDNIMIREPFVTSSSSVGELTIVDNPVVVIDFGLCRFRGENEDEASWVKSKAVADETGAAGVVLQRLVEDFVGRGVWVYSRVYSERYVLVLDDD